MDFLNVSLSAIGLLLGFSLSSLITVLIEWLKKKTEGSSDAASETTSDIQENEQPELVEKQKRKCRVFNLLSTRYSDFILDDIINILKIVSCSSVVLFVNLYLGYIWVTTGIAINNLPLRCSLLIIYYSYPIAGLGFMLLLLLNIKMRKNALLTRTSNIVAVVSVVWVIIVLIFSIVWKPK